MRKNPKRFNSRLAFLIAAGCSILVMEPESAYAQACGSTITRSLVLKDNIGPCSQTALIIPVGADHITVDLNGFKISGTGSAGSVGIDVQAGLVTIQGPGMITQFDLGVHVIEPPPQGGPRGTTVRRVNFQSNRIGVEIDGFDNGYGLNRILGNTFSGPGQTGVLIQFSSADEVRENHIRGQSQFGIRFSVARNSVVDRNTVTDNNTGMSFDFWCDFTTITKNVASGNRLDGIQSVAHGSLIEDNIVNRNGRDGMSVTHWMVRLQKNDVRQNSRRGIALVSGSSDYSFPITPDVYHITDNTVLHNGTDLYWDGQGTNNCWAGNKFGTSIPAYLPACP